MSNEFQDRFIPPERPSQHQHITVGLDDRTFNLAQSLVNVIRQHSTTLKRIETKVNKIMAEIDDVTAVLDGVNREVGQIVPFIRTLIEQVQAGANDKALATLVRDRIPSLQANIAALDEFTPEPPPTP